MEVKYIKKYVVKVFAPIIYEIYAETKEQATKIAGNDYERLKQKGKIAVDATSWSEPEIEVEEQETI